MRSFTPDTVNNNLRYDRLGLLSTCTGLLSTCHGKIKVLIQLLAENKEMEPVPDLNQDYRTVG